MQQGHSHSRAQDMFEQRWQQASLQLGEGCAHRMPFYLAGTSFLRYMFMRVPLQLCRCGCIVSRS